MMLHLYKYCKYYPMLTPSFWQKFSDGCRSHFCEESSSMHAPKMGQVTIKVQFIRYHC